MANKICTNMSQEVLLVTLDAFCALSSCTVTLLGYYGIKCFSRVSRYSCWWNKHSQLPVCAYCTFEVSLRLQFFDFSINYTLNQITHMFEIVWFPKMTKQLYCHSFKGVILTPRIFCVLRKYHITNMVSILHLKLKCFQFINNITSIYEVCPKSKCTDFPMDDLVM